MAELTELQRTVDARRGDQASRGGVQHVLRRPAAAAAVGDARRVEALIKRHDRGYITSTADRFRFEMLQSRFQKMIEVWDRGLRAREDGRPGPFAKPRPPGAAATAEQETDSSKVRARHRAQGSASRDGQGARALRLADGGAARAGRRRRPVSPLRGARQGSGLEAARFRNRRSGVPCGREGWEGELYGAGTEGWGRRNDRRPGAPRSGAPGPVRRTS